FGSFSASQVTQPSQASSDLTGDPTTTSATDATGGSTGALSATEAPGTTTTPDPSGTTTGVDPSTTTTDDPVTTVPPDPSTTTGVDPSTTTGVDPGTTTTGDPPDPPPMKDPQPADGLYESCLDNAPCNVNLTDGCFTITDAMTMKVIDGYCTLLCQNVADCGPAPKAPAVQECLTISLNPAQKVCALKCTGVADCPTGMACTGLALPNNAMGSYCT
ncbi:MAG: hypothetical protein JNK56_01660, partial [Myxococcales bacterium]|nr:hypothetical protein [Myxococcales bacterium]